ncbi:cysteine repeat modular protein A-like isoform X1 [Oculina patagonica]
MFEKCHKCGQGGLTCQDDYASLKAGYWWEWRNVSHTDRYRDFIANLLTSSPALDASSVQYPFPIPTPYKCPREESCKGGLDSSCENGYEGPLCEVCGVGYYKQLQTCTQCPSKKWMVGQLSIITTIVIIFIVVFVWINKRRNKTGEHRPLIDMFLSKLKIVIGFYQVTYGLLETFSYIKWPGSLEVIAKYSGILQMDVLHIAPIHCLFSKFRVDAFGHLLAMMIINASVISLSVIAYAVRRVMILQSRNLQDDEKTREISQTKETMLRNLFFFLYVTYLSTCAKTANVLPLACQKVCRDEKEEFCYSYMKADYSIQCQGAKYNHWLIVAYISTAYIIALPASSFIALWRQREILPAVADADALHPNSGTDVISGLRFLFENYKHRSWYWELVEMSRKVILTSALILVGQESRSYIGLAWVIAGMYGMLFSWIKPINDVTENRLMATSLAVTVVNLGIGAVSKIPAENIPASMGKYVDADAILFKLLVIGANTSVLGLLFYQYTLFLHQYLKEWRKNPHWSFSCCLALLLPLNDLQGEIRGLVGTNVLSSQLQSGEFEKPTVLSAVKDSGAIDVTLESDQGDDDTTVVQDESCRVAKYSDTRRHQATQAELCLLSTPDIVIHVPMRKSQERLVPKLVEVTKQ